MRLLYTSRMRIPGLPRRWVIAGAISLGAVLVVTLCLLVIYPLLASAGAATTCGSGSGGDSKTLTAT